MGLIGNLLGVMFGGGRNAIRETIEVFRPNAEADAVREAAQSAAALSQFAAEFTQPRRGLFDRFVDGLNRLPRPALALGTIGLFVSALVDPVWFSQRMQGVALIPEPLWWLMGAIVSFYFGARHQAKTHELQQSLAATLARTSTVVENIEALDALRKDDPLHADDLPRKDDDPLREDDALLEEIAPAATPRVAQTRQDPLVLSNNAALRDWRASNER